MAQRPTIVIVHAKLMLPGIDCSRGFCRRIAGVAIRLFVSYRLLRGNDSLRVIRWTARRLGIVVSYGCGSPIFARACLIVVRRFAVRFANSAVLAGKLGPRGLGLCSKNRSASRSDPY